MTRLLSSILLGLTLAALPACGGDDDGGSDGSDGPDEIDAGDGDSADAAPEGPDAATPDAFVPLTAAEFCDLWDNTCTYGEGGNYADVDDCETTYDTFDEGQKGCVFDHWGFAEAAVDDSQAEDDHCGHASGNPPCN